MTRFRSEGLRRRRVGVVLLAAGALVVAGVSATEAALTTPSCLAKQLKEWGKLRKCQAVENGKALQGKSADPAKCQTTFDLRLAAINAKATAAAIACRYAVHTGAEAGTVTDYDTGLQWEQKTDDGSVHDKDNGYTWSTVAAGPPNGTVYTVFVRTLNDATSSDGGATISGCFANHCDWRLSSIVELRSIVLPTCGGSPCIDETAFGPTRGAVHWSDTVVIANAPWGVNVLDGAGGGGTLFCSTTESSSARAVPWAL